MQKKFFLIAIAVLMLSCATQPAIVTVTTEPSPWIAQIEPSPTSEPTISPIPFPTRGPSLTPIPYELPTNTPTPVPTEFSELLPPEILGWISTRQTITYCRPDGFKLLMDIYIPLGEPILRPAILYVHGGGWREGTRMDAAGVEFFDELILSGFVVASIEYRLAPADQFPAMIEDVKCAVRFLRAHALTYQIDPDRIGAFGTSAGGHLVSLLGLADESAGWDVGEYLDQSSRVQAVVTMYAPSDLSIPSIDAGVDFLADVFGADDLNDPIYVLASPVTYTSPDDPPFLIIHGVKDNVVPFAQSEELLDVLKSNGVDAHLIKVLNAGHALRRYEGQTIDPSLDHIVADMILFFQLHLFSN